MFRANKPRHLSFAYDPCRDVLTIEGVQYSAALFRMMAGTEEGVGLKVGTPIEITRRDPDGMVVLTVLDADRLREHLAKAEEQVRK